MVFAAGEARPWRKALNHIERSNRVNEMDHVIEAGRAAAPIVAGGQDALIDGHTARADWRLRGEPTGIVVASDRVRRSRGADLA